MTVAIRVSLQLSYKPVCICCSDPVYRPTLEQTPPLLFLGSLWLAIFFGFNGVSKEKPALFLDPLASHFRREVSQIFARSTGGHG